MELLTAPLSERLAERQRRRGTFEGPSGRQVTIGSKACAYEAYRWVAQWTRNNERVWAMYQEQRRVAAARGVQYPQSLVQKYQGVMAGIQQQWVAAIRVAADMYEHNRMPATEVPPRTTPIASIRDAVTGHIQMRMNTIADWRRAADRIEREVNGWVSELPRERGGVETLDYTKPPGRTKTIAGTAPQTMGIAWAAIFAAPFTITLLKTTVVGVVVWAIARYALDTLGTAFGVNNRAIQQAERGMLRIFERLLEDCEEIEDREKRRECIVEAGETYIRLLSDANEAGGGGGGNSIAGITTALTVGVVAVAGAMTVNALTKRD